MQVIHLGFHKTGTTGLQEIVFRNAGVPFHGIGAVGTTEADRQRLLRFIRGERIPALEPLRSQSCILSDESALLRFGGRDAVAHVAADIAAGFADPVVVLTTRRQEALLPSAYVQSVTVRRRALGFVGGRCAYTRSVLLLSFSAWWHELERHDSRSLAGLLHFRSLASRLREVVGASRVCVLPLERIREDPDGYVGELTNVGLPEAAARDFVTAPPRNSGEQRPLRRERPWLRRLLQPVNRLLVGNQGELCDRLLRRVLVGGPTRATPVGAERVLPAITAYYAADTGSGNG